MDGSGVEPWIALLRDSRASLSVSQEKKKEQPTSDISGLSSARSSAQPKFPSFSLRMSQDSLFNSDSIAYSEILPKWGSMRSGVISPRAMWEPRTNGNESSFWPSARSEDSESCGNHPESADSLMGVVGLWTTPQAHDTTERGSGQQPSSEAGNACLARDARRWPMPSANDSKGTAKLGQTSVEVRLSTLDLGASSLDPRAASLLPDKEAGR